MANIVNKLKKYYQIKKAFKTASFILQNGKYNIRDNRFIAVQDSNDKSTRLRFRVNSKKKADYLLREGILKITPYKYLFMDNKQVFSFVRGEERFLSIKSNVESNLLKLPYKTMSADFVLDRDLIISNVIKGEQFDDEDHLWLFFDYYLNAINKEFIEERQINMLNGIKSVLFYPQHGDCHSKNIFWNGGIPTLIDLDDVDSYPLFYDVFYYIIASFHEEAFKLLRTDRVTEKLKVFFSNFGLPCPQNVIDYYLAAYVYFWVNKMKRKMPFHEINFYLKWFAKTDLSSFSLTAEAIEKYRRKLADLNIKK